MFSFCFDEHFCKIGKNKNMLYYLDIQMPITVTIRSKARVVLWSRVRVSLEACVYIRVFCFSLSYEVRSFSVSLSRSPSKCLWIHSVRVNCKSEKTKDPWRRRRNSRNFHCNIVLLMQKETSLTVNYNF